ncbi:unnamed protein product [Caenorhabditis angaria]|uniref:Uncharacterized protein n=1 Tax=Caenorhabditis angaria TaxID=860376 RepID=A0A9P1ICH0_9PELO|nr:unnamed protein product [Caenorhabditis angaria]
MRTILSLFLIVAAVTAYSAPHLSWVGEKNLKLELSSQAIKAVTRTLSNGKKQTFDFEGANKRVWIENGKKLDSKNYGIQAPGTLIIKSVTKDDAGEYDFIELKKVELNLPPGVHVDPAVRGIKLDVFPQKPTF